MTPEDFKAFAAWREANPLESPEDGDYAELVDENDENGAVRICAKDGRVKMLMPRSVYDDLVKETKGKAR